MKISERFLPHNLESPIVRSAWLDKNKKSPRGKPDTWMFMRVTLADGTVYDLPSDEVKAMNAADIRFRWAGVSEPA